MYDFLITGAGIYGSVCARELTDKGYKCLVIDKRNHIGGNCYTELQNNINVHMYGSHIFHTNNDDVWNYINRFVKFNNYNHQVKVVYKDKLYSYPISLYTLQELWGVDNKEDAIKLLDEKKIKIDNTNNLEEYCLSIIGEELYETFIKGYTIKQWQKDPKDLPASIVKRNPIKLEYEYKFFLDKFQGIPIDGYTQIFDKLLDGVQVRLNTFYEKSLNGLTKNIIYTGTIDSFFDYKFGELEYRSLIFKHELKYVNNFQTYGCVNYTDCKVPYTRITEHKHYENSKCNSTILTYEYPSNYGEPCYPIDTEDNLTLYNKYLNYSKGYNNIYFGGRLGSYKYLNMDETIKLALNFTKEF